MTYQWYMHDKVHTHMISTSMIRYSTVCTVGNGTLTIRCIAMMYDKVHINGTHMLRYIPMVHVL